MGPKRTPLGSQGPAHLHCPPAPSAFPRLHSHSRAARTCCSSAPGAWTRTDSNRPSSEARQLSEAGDHSSAASVLQEGLGLWRGRPCPELTEHSWATAETARLEELRREAEEELAELHLAMGEGTRLVGELEARVAAEPLRERRWAQLMLAYYRAGRQADALRAFARLRTTLAEELGVSPSADLVALEQRVLLQSPELDERRLPTQGGHRSRPTTWSCAAPEASQQLRRPGWPSGRGGHARRKAPSNSPRQVGDPVLVCEGLRAVDLSTADLGLAGPSENARHRAALEELLAVAEAYGDLGFSLAAHGNLSVTSVFDNDLQASRAHVERQVELASELGVKSPFIDHRLGELLFFEGDYPGSLARQRSAFEQARRQDLSMYLADVATEVASVVLKLGRDPARWQRVLYGFAAHELEIAGFSRRMRGYVETKTRSRNPQRSPWRPPDGPARGGRGDDSRASRRVAQRPRKG